MILSVWGSERRMEEVRRLARYSHTCVAREDLQTLDLSMLDALILPLHGVQGRRGEYMDREHIALPDGFWACLREDCLIISGMPSPFWSRCRSLSTTICGMRPMSAATHS